MSLLLVLVTPLITKELILLVLRLWEAMVWKNLVLPSPSSNHFCLALTAQYCSSSLYNVSNWSLQFCHALDSISVKALLSCISSNSWSVLSNRALSLFFFP